jgi:hypothetical protein
MFVEPLKSNFTVMLRLKCGMTESRVEKFPDSLKTLNSTAVQAIVVRLSPGILSLIAHFLTTAAKNAFTLLRKLTARTCRLHTFEFVANLDGSAITNSATFHIRPQLIVSEDRLPRHKCQHNLICRIVIQKLSK